MKAALAIATAVAAKMTQADISEGQSRARVGMAYNYEDCDDGVELESCP